MANVGMSAMNNLVRQAKETGEKIKDDGTSKDYKEIPKPIISDEMFKKIFSHRAVAATVIRSMIPEYRKYSIEEVYGAITASPDNSKLIDTGVFDIKYSGKLIEFDVMVKMNGLSPELPSNVFVKVDLEMQNDPKPKYPLEKRIMYYLSRLVGADLNKGDDYNEVGKSYTLWIVPGIRTASGNIKPSGMNTYYTVCDTCGIAPEPNYANFGLGEAVVIYVNDGFSDIDWLDEIVKVVAGSVGLGGKEASDYFADSINTVTDYSERSDIMNSISSNEGFAKWAEYNGAMNKEEEEEELVKNYLSTCLDMGQTIEQAIVNAGVFLKVPEDSVREYSLTLFR